MAIQMVRSTSYLKCMQGIWLLSNLLTRPHHSFVAFEHIIGHIHDSYIFMIHSGI